MAMITSPAEKREVGVQNALSSVRMEGLEPSEGAKELLQRFANGQLTSVALDAAFAEFLTRTYGSVPLSRNASSC